MPTTLLIQSPGIHIEFSCRLATKMADAVNLQYQVRQNNEELQDFLKDLYQWEDEVQAKDKLLVNSKNPTGTVGEHTFVYKKYKCTVSTDSTVHTVYS